LILDTMELSHRITITQGLNMAHWDVYWSIALRLSLALLVGVILGLNRWLHHKSAGIRTHSLVAIGSATAIMLIDDFVKDDAQAVSRVLQGLITGLGFLGAGVIIRERSTQKVHGLTTAASVWSCALIAAAFGGGQFILGGGGTRCHSVDPDYWRAFGATC